MQVPISSITVEERVRKEIGDLSPLVESMQKYGQLSPLVLTRQNELIAGHRRLLAAKRLGWYTVDVTYVDRDSDVEKLEMELQENVHRKDFSPEELLQGYSRLEKLRRPSLARRLRDFFKRLMERLFSKRRRRKARSAGEAESSAKPDAAETAVPDSPYDFEDSEFNP